MSEGTSSRQRGTHLQVTLGYVENPPLPENCHLALCDSQHLGILGRTTQKDKSTLLYLPPQVGYRVPPGLGLVPSAAWRALLLTPRPSTPPPQAWAAPLRGNDRDMTDDVCSLAITERHKLHSRQPPNYCTIASQLRVPQKEVDKRSSIAFFRLWDSFGHFLVTFADASVTFSSLFCQTPFARLLLRQCDQQPRHDDFCRIMQRPRNATTVKWQVKNCTKAAKCAWDFLSLYGWCPSFGILFAARVVKLLGLQDHLVGILDWILVRCLNFLLTFLETVFRRRLPFSLWKNTSGKLLNILAKKSADLSFTAFFTLFFALLLLRNRKIYAESVLREISLKISLLHCGVSQLNCACYGEGYRIQSLYLETHNTYGGIAEIVSR